MKQLIKRLESKLKVRGLVQDAILTAPSPFFRSKFASSIGEKELSAALAQLRATGAYLPDTLIDGTMIAEIRAALQDALDGRRDDIRVVTEARTGIQHLMNPMHLNQGLITLAADPSLLAIAESYLKRRVYLADVDFRRVPPMSMAELDQRAGTQSVGYTSSHWHRDIRGRQVKVMIYLTDVGPNDSNFVFLPASHAGHHMRPRHVEVSRFSDVEVRQINLAPHECYGPAGTTMLFDTNIVHRLRRKPGANVRDSVTFYYTPGQELRPLYVAVDELTDLTPAQRSIFGGSRPSLVPAKVHPEA